MVVGHAKSERPHIPVVHGGTRTTTMDWEAGMAHPIIPLQHELMRVGWSNCFELDQERSDGMEKAY